MFTDEVCCLQSDIMDVNQIFKDLSVLVHEQADVVGESFLPQLIFIVLITFATAYRAEMVLWCSASVCVSVSPPSCDCMR